jgi:hypothetical protein
MRAVIAVVAAVIAVARPAMAEPTGARVLTAPTAWLPAAGTAVAMLGVDHRGDGAAIVSYGLGGIAEAELGADTDVRGCRGCERPRPLWLGRAAFRIGARQDAWFHGMPAIVLGVRATFAGRGHAVHAPRASEAYLVASRDLGVVRLHVGVDALSAEVDGRRAAARVRPLAGLEIHPPMYPRSSLIGDLAWAPSLVAPAAPAVGWTLGIGVRFQALPWASVELAVRAREAEDLGASTVLLRVNAVRRGTAARVPRSRPTGSSDLGR